MFKELAKRSSRMAGLEVRRRENVPWGADPFFDLKALAQDIKLAFDVGANVGQTAVRLRELFPAAQIHSFEPVPATFEALKRNLGGDAKVTCVPAALGAAQGEAAITAVPCDGQNTLLSDARPDAPRVTVPVETVDDYADRQGFSEIDLLKIDVEGFELAVLEGARGLLSRGSIGFVLAECEFTANEETPHGDFFAMAEMLLPLGYRIVSFYTGGVDGDGWNWGDVLFARPRRRPITCSPFAPI